jgi:hypothetical protein
MFRDDESGWVRVVGWKRWWWWGRRRENARRWFEFDDDAGSLDMVAVNHLGYSGCGT